MLFHNWLIGKWKSISLKFGFNEYDSPILEHSDLWVHKAGGNTDILNEMFAFSMKDTKLTLRPEMTPSLARMMLNYLPSQVLPVKLFSVPQCWRNEDVSRGRKREFYQWNIDIFGGTKVKSEIELFSILIDFFKSIGLTSNRLLIYPTIKSNDFGKGIVNIWCTTG